MPNNSFEHTQQQVLQAMQQHAGQSSLKTDAFSELASTFTETWQKYQAEPDTQTARELGARFVHHGLNLHSLIGAGRALQSTAGSAAETIWLYLGDILEGYVAGTKRAAQQAAIAEMQATQQREDQLRAVIQELSTPIIPIYQGVLVLPLVGTIDSIRSQEITERLLEDIVRQQADMVIIDITGVSVVDTSVANHLIMTAQAVNLLGSRVIFTGISSTIAQTIIQLGVNLGDVVTLSNLQAGMSFALEQLGLGITRLAVA